MPPSTCKNGHLVRTAVTAVYASGRSSSTLDAVAAAVLALVGQTLPATPARPEVSRPAAELSGPADTV